MTKEEAIKYLQQLYSNGGHCWLDEQRMEAIGMAVKALQEEPMPKFKAGDHIRPIDNCIGSPRTILEVCDGWYVTNQGTLDFEFEGDWEAVEEPVWIKELQDKLDSLSKEDFDKILAKYDKYDKVEEPVSEEWIEELRTKLDSMSKEDFKKVFDKYAVDFNDEPVSEDLEKIVEEIAEPTILNAYGTKELARRLLNTICGTSVSEELEDEITDYINNHFSECEDGILLSDAHSSELQYTDVADIARHFANWQKQQDSKLPKIWPRDTIEEYAYQCAYDLSNDWAKETPEWNDVQNACILGAQWQKEKDMQKFLHSETATFTREEFDAEMEEVRKQTQKQMMKDAVEGVITFDYYREGDKTYGCIAHDSFCLEDRGLKDMDKVKIAIIKED